MLLDCILGSNSSWLGSRLLIWLRPHLESQVCQSIIRVTHSCRSFSSAFSSSSKLKSPFGILIGCWSICREVGLEWSMFFWELSEAIFVLISWGDLMTGIYPPQVRVYEVSELSLKFERHLTSEIIDFQVRFEFSSRKFLFKGVPQGKPENWVQSVAWKLEIVVWVAGTSRWLFQTGLFVRRSNCMVACKIWQLLQYSDSEVVIIHCTIFSLNLECFPILRIIWSFVGPILKFC